MKPISKVDLMKWNSVIKKYYTTKRLMSTLYNVLKEVRQSIRKSPMEQWINVDVKACIILNKKITFT